MKATKRTRYFLIALCLTTCFMLLKKSNILDLNILRNLIDQSKKNYLCDKAGSRLTEKYQTDFSEEDIERESLSSAQQSIIDFARDSSYSNIKPYLKRVGIFLAFIVLDLIFIFFWIAYCCCCCCRCCLFSDAQPSKFCSCLWLFIAIICNFLALIFSIVVLVLIGSFYKRLNGLGCSAVTFLDHVNKGLAPDYSSRNYEWDGLESLIYKVENIQTQSKAISSNPIFNEIENEESNYQDVCNNEYNQLKGDAKVIQNLLYSSFDSLTQSDAIDDLKSVNDDIVDTEDDVVDDVYDAMHDHTNKYGKKLLQAIFIVTLVISFLGMAILILFLFCKNLCLKVIYVFIWNISMLIMYFAILLAATFGIIGYIFEDAVQVAVYILSSENLNSDDPLVFEENYKYDQYGNKIEDDNYISDLIEICANGDGNFTNVIKGGQELNSHLEEWKQNKNLFTQRRDSINCNNGDKLKNYYNELIGFVDQSLYMTYNITNVTCRFARNDKNILLNEAKSGGKKGIALAALGFLVGILLGISVLAGIIFIHKYYATWKEDNNGNNPTNDTSSAHIEQEDNNTTANQINNMVPNPNNEVNPK